MCDKTRSVVFRGTREDGREAEDTRANILRACVILNIALTNELGPLERRLPAVVCTRVLVNSVNLPGVAAVDVFSRRIHKRRPRLHVANHVCGAVCICAKALDRALRTFVEMRGEVDYRIVVCDFLDCLLVENVET